MAALGVTLALPLGAAAADSATDLEVRARIEAKLEELNENQGAAIRVAVQEGQVILQGRVRLLEQSLQAERLVWKTPGVSDVENELRVVPLEAGGDAAIERQIRTLIKGDERFLNTSPKLTVIAGFVRLQGRFHNPADVLDLKHRIASIPGVLDVEIDATLVARRDVRPRAVRS